MPYIGAGVQRFNTADNLTVTGTSELKNDVTVTGDVTASGTVLPTGDTAAGDAAALGFTSAEGLILTGQGSTSDITVKNDADTTVFTVPTGTDDILFPDNAKAMFGASSDLQISHNGSNSVIEDLGEGNLKIKSNGSGINFQKGDAELLATMATDGAVTLYHDNSAKLATASTGVDITGGVTATDTCTFSSANNVAQLILKSTDADADSGPQLDLTRDSGSPADGDSLGLIRFMFDNDAGQSIVASQFETSIVDASDSTEDGRLIIRTMTAGTSTSRLDFTNTETVFNDSSIDVDFRVESNGNDKMIFVDGENDLVGIGGTPNVLLHVIGPAAQVAIDTTSGGEPLVRFRENGTTRGLLKMDGSNNMQFHTGPDGSVAEVARFNASGHLNIGQTSTNIPGQGNSTAGTSLRGVGDAYFSRDGDIALNVNRNGSDGKVVSFRRGGTEGGSISVTTTAATLASSSDSRLKSNIQDAASASDKIDAIQVRQFDWNETGNHQDYGLIAQELQPIEPLAVVGSPDSDEMMGIDNSKLVPMLIKAVQEQQATIKLLETRLAALESQENKLTQNIITIDGKEYKPEDMDEKQTYLISQIRSCQNKAANIRFELDQVQEAQNVFTNELIKSVQTEGVQAEVG